MKSIKIQFPALILLFLCVVLSASAQVAQPVIAYVTIQGVKSGTFKGGATLRGNEGKIECIGFSYTVKSPRDAASGLPTGKRIEGTVNIIKHVDGATPQILQSLYQNETLKSVTIAFYKKNAAGVLELYETVQLTNASISQISQYGGIAAPEKVLPNAIPDEEISFTYQKIQTTNNESNTTAMDTWESPN